MAGDPMNSLLEPSRAMRTDVHAGDTGNAAHPVTLTDKLSEKIDRIKRRREFIE